MSTRLVFVRHGQTDFNRDRRLQGQIDIPLNNTGRRQAAQLARSIVQDAPDVIVSSPLSRAHDTALAVAEVCDLGVTTDAAFLERGFGQWEGLRDEEIKERWPHEHAQLRAHQPVEGLGVEDRPVVAARVADAARALVAEHPDRTVMVVAHGAAITLGITELLGLDTTGFQGLGGLENCHRSTLTPLWRDPEGRAMRLLSHNVTPDFT